MSNSNMTEDQRCRARQPWVQTPKRYEGFETFVGMDPQFSSRALFKVPLANGSHFFMYSDPLREGFLVEVSTSAFLRYWQTHSNKELIVHWPFMSKSEMLNEYGVKANSEYFETECSNRFDIDVPEFYLTWSPEQKTMESSILGVFKERIPFQVERLEVGFYLNLARSIVLWLIAQGAEKFPLIVRGERAAVALTNAAGLHRGSWVNIDPAF